MELNYCRMRLDRYSSCNSAKNRKVCSSPELSLDLMLLFEFFNLNKIRYSIEFKYYSIISLNHFGYFLMILLIIFAFSSFKNKSIFFLIYFLKEILTDGNYLLSYVTESWARLLRAYPILYSFSYFIRLTNSDFDLSFYIRAFFHASYSDLRFASLR